MVITQNQRIASVDVETEKGSPDTLSGILINTVSRMDISQNIRNGTVMIPVPFTRLLSKGHVLKRHLHVTSTVQAQGSLAHTTPSPVCTYVSSSRFMGTNNAADIHKVVPFRLWDKREVCALLRNTLLGSSGSLATWLTLRNTLWSWTSQTQKGEYYTILHVCGG